MWFFPDVGFDVFKRRTWERQLTSAAASDDLEELGCCSSPGIKGYLAENNKTSDYGSETIIYSNWLPASSIPTHLAGVMTMLR